MEIVTLLLALVYVIFGALLLALLIVGLSVLLKVNKRLKNADSIAPVPSASTLDQRGADRS